MPASASAYPRPGYAWYVAGLLMTIYMAAYVDRYLLSLLIEPIKADLSLSDFQIGLLIGPAFVMFFVTLGLPLGWLTDRANRTRPFRSRLSSYASVFLGIVGVTAIGGSSFWAPALFERTWGWGVGKTGLAIGVVLLVTGLIGTTLGGWLAARWVRRGVYHGPYLTVLLGCCVIFPTFTLFPLMPSAEAAVALLFVGFLGMSITSGTSPSAVVGITPSQLRGQMTALFFFTINLLGGLTGPPLVGLVADALGGGDNLRYGMAITCAAFGLMMCSVLVWGLPHYRRSAAAFATGSNR